MKPLASCLPLGALILAGCLSDARLLANKQPLALQTAESRARFEMNCPRAKGKVLSQEVIEVREPAARSPDLGSVSQAEYTIGVLGCGKRKTYVVVCPAGGDGCFAGEDRGTAAGK
jgi:hypothetical protein